MEKISINKNFILRKNKFAIRNFSFAIIFVFVALFGLFCMVGKASAQTLSGICVDGNGNPVGINPATGKDYTQSECAPGPALNWKILNSTGEPVKKCTVTDSTKNGTPGFIVFVKESVTNPHCSYDYLKQFSSDVKQSHAYVWANDTSIIERGNTTGNAFEDEISKNECGVMEGSIYPGCFIQFFYVVFYTIPSWILYISAYFFNVLISITLSSTLFTKPFVSEAWGVVRDLSNIFFILILLFVAFETILGLAHDAQKTITKVIVIAILINFSMFFTQVVIDTSNVVALVFYNKMSVSTKDAKGNERPYQKTANGEKDVAGGLVNAFNPTKLITPEYLNNAKTQIISADGTERTQTTGNVAPGILMGMLLITGILMFFASYCLIVSGLSFLGRMIELFVLIIFSPFAFMSSTLPKLSGTDYLGWDAWSKRLISISFMAPIFMFFLYFIFMLIHSKIFDGLIQGTTTRMIESILMIVLPALLILMLLLKATEYAKKGSGKFGEAVMTGAKLVGGLALGAATGGAALVASNTIGARAQRTANDDNLKAGASGNIDDKTRAHFAKMGITSDEKIKAFSQKKLATANKYANKSFDIRDTGIGKFAAKKSGMDFNQGTSVLGVGADKLKGGRVKQTERKVEELEKIKKTYELSGSAADKQNDRNKEYNDDLAQTEKNFGRTFSDKEKEEFKKDYEAGKDLSTKYGIGKKIEAGSIKTSKEINNDRKKAYLVSLEDAATKEAGKNAAKTFWDEFKSEEKKMYTTAGGIAQTVALGAATGGIGLVAGPLALSLARAIKTTVAKKVMGDVRSTNAEVIASLRKGPDEYKELIKKMKKDLEGGGHGASAPTPAHPKTPAPVSPTPSAGPAHAGGHHTP